MNNLEDVLIREIRSIAKARGFNLPSKVAIDNEKHFFDGTGNGGATEWYKSSIQKDTVMLSMNSNDSSLKRNNDYVLDVGIKWQS